MAKRGDGFGRWTVRWLALLGVAARGVRARSGGGSSTRVLEADGFADVVAKASQREEVRDYIADQATLRLARTSNFVSAARPVVTDAVSAAIDDPAGEGGDPRLRPTRPRAGVPGAAAPAGSTSTRRRRPSRSAARCRRSTPRSRRSCPPTCSMRPPRSRSPSTVDLLFRTSRWVEDLYLPVVPRRGRAARPSRWSRRATGSRPSAWSASPLAVAGALLLGVGVASPAFVVGRPGPTTRCRGDAVAAFIEVLVGRLLGRRPGCSSSSASLLALAPGPRRRRPPPPRGAGAGVGRGEAHAAALALRRRRRRSWCSPLLRAHDPDVAVPHDPGRGGAARALRGHRDLPARQRAARHRPLDHEAAQAPGGRRVRGDDRGDRVHGAPSPSALVAGNTDQPRGEPQQPGVQRLHRAVRAAAQPDRVAGEPQRDVVERVQLPRRRAHDHDPRAAERGRPVPDARRVLRLRRQRPRAHEPRRRRRTASSCGRSAAKKPCASSTALGALTGVADTSGKKQDVYFCHDFCELGAVPASQIFRDIDDFLDRNLTDVVIIDVEDYVQAEGPQAGAGRVGLVATACGDRARSSTGGRSLLRHGGPKNGSHTENPRRLIVMSEKHAGEQPVAARHLRRRRRRRRSRSRRSRLQLQTEPRGHRQVVLHRQPLAAARTARPTRSRPAKSTRRRCSRARLQQCIAQRQQIPNVVAVDFTAHRRPVQDRQPVQRGHRAPVRRHRDGVEGGEPAPQPGGHHRRRGHRAERAPPPPGDLGDVGA